MTSPYSSSTPQNRPYVGRFAPSPSGPLHMGSLVCALASYLHAKQHNGRWFVRIEDLDTPRVDASMSEMILDSLACHHLHWDGDVIYQSQQFIRYEAALQQLNAQSLIYACTCTRKEIKARCGAYDGHCRHANLPINGNTLRFKQTNDYSHFYDIHLGRVHIEALSALEDPVLKRRDGIYAYHLAVVVDDIAENVTHIVRGNDILDTTPVHLALYEKFQQVPPQYLHIPVIGQTVEQKLSKQHHAPAINNAKALDNLKLALRCLGVGSDASMMLIDNIDDLLAWSIEHWTSNLLSKQTEVLISVTNNVYSWQQP